EVRPDEDQRSTHNEGADDAPKQHPVRGFRGDGKLGEQQGENEQVVHAEGFFNEVAGEKLQARLRRKAPVNVGVEAKGDKNPHGAGDGGFPDSNPMGIAVQDEKVEGKHADEEDVE